MAKFPTTEEFAKDVAEKVLDDYEYEGKTIREWIALILTESCEGCAYSNRKRPQKCSCCRRNIYLKDCYEEG